MREGGEHAQWRSRLTIVTFKEAGSLKMKALLLKVNNGIYNGGLVEFVAEDDEILVLCSRVKRMC